MNVPSTNVQKSKILQAIIKANIQKLQENFQERRGIEEKIESGATTPEESSDIYRKYLANIGVVAVEYTCITAQVEKWLDDFKKISFVDTYINSVSLIG